MKFALGALDGISYFHSKNEVDEEQLEFLKKILKLLQPVYAVLWVLLLLCCILPGGLHLLVSWFFVLPFFLSPLSERGLKRLQIKIW